MLFYRKLKSFFYYMNNSVDDVVYFGIVTRKIKQHILKKDKIARKYDYRNLYFSVVIKKSICNILGAFIFNWITACET